ncbi:U7 snRNA-associated Sm-like protein LSm10 [Tribolium castaneum]|uniref:U7 snRNA-associated Sm-like protein LSm10 n=1 Tax=Tribolium castaneum TaxID=7070 RepID=D6WR34_TRICA|nr:PREDICTED: U7 snRNA-associated Sm-like protein LSm10 [Tribolium castaneum]EFA07013.1 U7 snRNA-associated Sm-like protein LSm10 [Tribolium castaneum]|eukprot:XP_008195900.1 PREDICTED: U7 snRNA-associated Sm-like protein LSm10 [Tribolium castaneum]
MQDFGSKKEKYYFHNYLTSLVKALENKHTVIDLRNESCVSGLIKHVDGLMNVEMGDVVFYDPRGQRHYFKDFFVSARNIRYVHIPEGLSSTQLLENQMNLLQHTKVREPRKETFKTKRAKRYNAEILSSLNINRPGPSTG